MSKLNEKIRILLANNELTEKDLAEYLHFSSKTVSKWVTGKNHPKLNTIKELCKLFYIPIQDLTNDELDIPEYYEIGRYLPYPICCYPESSQDSLHIVYDADLADEGKLHRFNNPAGIACSAIYRGNIEVWWNYREHEARMIKEWNERGYK